MQKRINRYNFDKISSRMMQKFGNIKKGEEDTHAFQMFPMESNMLKLHREDNKRDSRRAIEAIHITLLTIEGYLTDTEYDFGSFLTEENEALAKGLLMSFDPFTNAEVKEVLESEYELDSKESLETYFQEPVRCLLRIEKSIEFWMRSRGNNGYFDYIEDLMGDTIKNDEKMDFGIIEKEEE